MLAAISPMPRASVARVTVPCEILWHGRWNRPLISVFLGALALHRARLWRSSPLQGCLRWLAHCDVTVLTVSSCSSLSSRLKPEEASDAALSTLNTKRRPFVSFLTSLALRPDVEANTRKTDTRGMCEYVYVLCV